MPADDQDTSTPSSALPDIGADHWIPTQPVEPLTEPIDAPVYAPPLTTDQQPRRSGRVTSIPVRYGHESSPTAMATRDHDHPTYTMAMNGPDKQAWLTEME